MNRNDLFAVGSQGAPFTDGAVDPYSAQPVYLKPRQEGFFYPSVPAGEAFLFFTLNSTQIS